MPPSAHTTYWETQVLTATPQRLRLMLIEGAIRFGRQALEIWHDEDRLQVRCAALARCNEVLTELFASVRPDSLPAARRTCDIYRFLLVQLAKVSQQDDAQALREVLEVLEVERVTWRQLCEQMPEAPIGHGDAGHAGEEITTSGMSAIPLAPLSPSATPPSSGLSLEA